MAVEEIGDDETTRHEGARPKSPITAKQAEARRQNGRKGGAARQSAQGRARSDEARVKHGVYAQTATWIRSGPLREDPEEVLEYQRRVVDAYGPRDPREELLVRDLAAARWRRERLRRWEARGYAAIGFEHGDSEAEWWSHLIHEARITRAVLAGLDEPDWHIRDLETAAGTLFQHPALDDADWTGVPDKASAIELRRLIGHFIAKAWDGDVDEAIRWIEQREEKLADDVSARDDATADVAAKMAITDSLTANVARMDAHLDRVIRRAEAALNELRGDRQGAE